MSFKKEDKYKMLAIEKIIKLYQGVEVETYINAFGNMVISPIDKRFIAPKLYLRKIEGTITLATIEVAIHNKGTATKIIEELIRIGMNSDEIRTIEIENILSPALKHIAVDKFKFTEDKFLKNTYVLNLDK